MKLNHYYHFPLNDAVIDIIVTHINAETKSATVLVIALKKENIEEYIELFKKINIQPDKITIDLIELYGLYTSLPQYANLKDPVALVDLGMYATRIAIIIDGKLKIVRVLQQGINNILKIIESENNMSHAEAYDYLFKFGMQDGSLLDKYRATFFNQIQFTIQASLSKITHNNQEPKILLTGIGTEIPHITEFLSTFMASECTILHAHKIIHNGTVAANSSISNEDIFSIATALSSKVTEDFNLRTDYISNTDKWVISLQLITALLLIFFTLGAFSLYTFFTLRKFKQEVLRSEQETVNQLKSVFTLSRLPVNKSGRPVSLESALTAGKSELAKEENIWFSLSTRNRFSFLTYLQELTSRIDREKLGLELKRFIIRTGEGNASDVIILEGSVKDYNALRAFEEALYESNMFKDIPKLQEPKFGTITLILDKSDREKI